MSDDTEAFARVRLDERGHVVDFTFGGVPLAVNSVQEAQTFVRRRAMTTGKETVLTIGSAQGEESESYSALGEPSPYFGPVPRDDTREDDELSMGFADAFDSVDASAQHSPLPVQDVPTQPMHLPPTGEYTAPSERVDMSEEWQAPGRQAAPRMPANPFGHIRDVDMSDFESEDVSAFEEGLGKAKRRKKAKKERPVKPKAAKARKEPKPRPEKAAREPKPRREVPPRTVMGIMAVGLAGVLVLGGGAGLATGIIPNPLASKAEEEPVAEEVSTELKKSVAEDLPGFDISKASYEFSVPSTAAVTASDRGTVVIDQKEIWIYDATTGKETYHGEAKAEISLTIDTTVGGEPALAWRAGDDLYVHLDSAPGKPVKVTLPKKAKVSSAGESLLITADDGRKFYTLSPDELRELTIPEDAGTVMAVDAEGALVAGFATPVTVLDAKGTTVRTVDLTPPSPTMSMSRWLSAGHGLAVIAWTTRETSESSSQPIVVAVHDLETGEAVSKVSTTQGELAEWKWVRGQGYDRAALGPYAFDMHTGALVADGRGIDATFTGASGPLLLGQMPDGPFAAHNLEAHPSDVTPLAVVADDSLALARTDQTTVAAYPATESEER